MMHVSLTILFSLILLCSAIVLPRDRRSAHQNSLTLLLSVRQGVPCLSRESCAENEFCFQQFGEPFCEEDCDGICLPQAHSDLICNCDDRCEMGTCVSAIIDAEPDNGICVPDDLATDSAHLKCDPPDPGKVWDDGSEEPREPMGEEKPSSEDDPNESKDGADGADTQPGDAAQEPPEPTAVPDDEAAPANSIDAIEGVCIGADMLDSFESHELVFPKHVLSRVLCDASGSCATAGHIVRYGGGGLMMSSYCAAVGCTEKVMYVNSPKYQAGLRVKSRSRGLQFTSLAARYGTRGEEVVLRAAVKLGL